MFKNPTFSVTVNTICVILFSLLIEHSLTQNIAFAIFIFFPFLAVWMVYSILRYGKYKGKELTDKEEWGYEDKDRDQLGTF
ncbi:MAG TPA: hypothetical protein VFN30_12505 [Chitinophagaceae bacterium]|nr:hypothetical protein [Chitinophagaceae bacterium]